MSAAETLYTFVQLATVQLERGRQQVSKLPVRRSRAYVTPSAATCVLLDAAGSVVASPTVAIVDSIAQATYAAIQLPSTLAYGETYLELWTLTIDGVARPFRRQVILARSELHPPLSDTEIIDGEYPDLLAQLGSLATKLQAIQDAAWREVLRTLYRRATPADVVVDSADVLDWYRHMVLERVFKAQFKAVGDADHERYVIHRDAAAAAGESIRALTDRDRDGVADSAIREPLGRAVHANVAPRARMPRGFTW